MSDTPPNPLEGLLSDFALGPAWARAKSDSPKPKFKEGAEREYKPRRRDDRGGREDRGGRDNREQRGGRGNDRRQGGNSRRDFQKGGRPDVRREEIAPAEGVNVSLFPQKEAIQLVCKEIQQVARVYPLFDIAQIILAEKNRSLAVFERSEKKTPFYSCKFEDAVFLTKEEALQHFLQADWRERFIEESSVEVEPPKGNYQSVAKCGISGEWLGPPNYHGYQTEVRRIHRERFSNMPFESYLSKVRTERSEEAVNEWLDSMKSQTRWRILSDDERVAAKAAEAEASKSSKPVDSRVAPKETIEPAPAVGEPTPEAVTAEESTEGNNVSPQVPASELPPSDSPPEEPTVSESAQAPEAEAPPAVEETPETSEPSEELTDSTPQKPAAEVTAPAEEIKWFTDRAEVERAIATELLEKAFKITHKAKVSAGIPGKNLSPGLLVRLKGTGSHHRKHPAIIIPAVCKVLETEHMPVFKRKGKLFTGPARPHALAPDAVLAPRPGEMVKWIRENTPAKLEGLWKAVLPEGATAPPAEYAADLFWLLQQGHILLYTDDTLAVQEQPKPQQPKKPKQPKKKADSKPSTAPTENTAEAGKNADATETAKEKPPTPSEAIADAVAETKEAVSEAASKVIDAVVAATAPEAPAPTLEKAEEETTPATETSEPTPEPKTSAEPTPDSERSSEPEIPAEDPPKEPLL